MIFQLTEVYSLLRYHYFEDPEGNGFKFYVDKDKAQWTRQNNLVEIDIRPLMYRDSVSHATKLLWFRYSR